MEHTSRKYWEQKISEWRSSGLNIRDWCQKSHTDVKQFYTWKKRLENSESESEETVFAEITPHYQYKRQDHRVPSPDTRPLLYYQGIKLYIPDQFNPDTLLSLLRTLKQL